MLVAVFGVWSYTTFEATLIRVGRSRTHLVLLTVMLFGLFMNAAITHAVETSAWAFVVPFLLIQLGRPVWTIATASHRVLRQHYVVMLGWLVASAPLWVAGAAFGPHARLAWWAAAATTDTVGTWLAHPIPGRVLRSEHIEFDVAHLVERCRLFLIVALGETLLTTGAAIAAAQMNAMTYFTGTCALVTTVSLWALYFAGSDHLVNEHVENTTDPILAGRLTLSGEIVVVAGLIALAVGNELVILHPHGDTPARLSLLLFGGPLLHLLLQAGYEGAVLHTPSRSRAIGIALLVVAAGLALLMPPYASLLLVATILSALVGAVLYENRRAVFHP